MIDDAAPASAAAAPSATPAGRPRSDRAFWLGMAVLGGAYVILIVAMVVAEATYTTWPTLRGLMASETLRFSVKLSLISCSVSTILCLWVATPLAYVLSRWDDEVARFGHAPGAAAGKWRRAVVAVARRARVVVDAVVDIPIVLPPLVVGLCLLILFSRRPLSRLNDGPLQVTYAVPGVILAQFTVSCAFAVRALRVTFDQVDPRAERVALTLGCSRAQAFWRVALPEARGGLLAAATLAWARALGEFGPILVFAGATRLRTEVLSTSVFLYLSTGELAEAVAVSLLMVAAAVVVMIVTRAAGDRDVLGTRRGR